MDNTNKKDLEILKSLYYGNHLKDLDLERAVKLIYLLNVELKSRIKEVNKK